MISSPNFGYGFRYVPGMDSIVRVFFIEITDSATGEIIWSPPIYIRFWHNVDAPMPTSVSEPVASCGSSPLNGRTQKVADAVVRELEGVYRCQDVTATQLARIQTLVVRRTDLRNLREGDFAGMDRLKTLYLNGNDLQSLPQNIFSQLSRLQQLDLSSNELTALPANIFSGTTDLRSLELDRNQLASLPAGIFNGMSRLRMLDLSQNPMGDLPAANFSGAGLRSLETLKFGARTPTLAQLSSYRADLPRLITLQMK